MLTPDDGLKTRNIYIEIKFKISSGTQIAFLRESLKEKIYIISDHN